MAKLCRQCFHTPRGVCARHDDKEEYNRKFLAGLEAVTMPLIEAVAKDIWMPKEERYPWMFRK